MDDPTSHLLDTPLPPVAAPDLSLPPGDLWVFGYGSLMWRPGFRTLDAQPALLAGYHRALCVWSWVHRGTRDDPGLVLGLDRGGRCRGMALRVAEAGKHEVADYLYRREMVTPVYVPHLKAVALADGRRVAALTFLVDRAHPQYAGRLDPAEAAATVRRARGIGGPNVDYVLSAVRHLDELGLPEGPLHAVARALTPPGA